jgi:hypothetical protein
VSSCSTLTPRIIAHRTLQSRSIVHSAPAPSQRPRRAPL